MKKVLLTTTILLASVCVMAQNDRSKKVKTQYLALPSYDVSAIDPSTISVEFSMKDGTFGTEKLKDTKSKCVPKGGSLKDVIEVTAYHFEIPYTQQESYIVAKSADGTIVYADKSSEKSQSSIRFGYDEKMKQSKCEYWVSDNLKKDFKSQGAKFKSSQHNKYVSSTFKNALEVAQANVSMSYVQSEFEVYSAKGKLYDYAELDGAFEKAMAAYESIKKKGVNEADFAQLKEAIVVWEKELETLDTEDKKARISKKIGKGLHENCARAYLVMFDFDNAKKHAEKFKGLFGNFSNNRTQAMDEIIKRIYLQKVAAEKNSTIINDLSALHGKASGSKGSVASKNVGSAEFDRLQSEFYKHVGSQAQAVNEELKKEEEEAIASGELNPYQKFYFPTLAGGEGVAMTMPPSALSGIPEIDAFPVEICEFENAKQVIIMNNSIASIPPEIAKLKNLKKLDLTGNKLTSLPAEIGQLENLETLKLSKNPLESLPDELLNCTKLKSLVIKGTKVPASDIQKIQDAFPKCKIKN